MSARSAFAWMKGEVGQTLPGTLARWLAWLLDHLALTALVTTIFLLGYWHPLTITLFPQGWISPQYSPLLTVPVSDISALITIILWIIARLFAAITRQVRAPLSLGPASLTLPLLGLAALSALSATQAINPVLSDQVALDLCVLLAFVIAILNLRPPIWAIIAPLALLLPIEGVLSLLQVRAQSTLLSNVLYGWNFNFTASQSGASVVQLADGVRWLRGYGTYPNPNILGGFLCLAIPLVAHVSLRFPWRSLWRWVLLAALALGLLALLLSFSRAAWLGILAGALWASWLFWLRRRAACSAAVSAAGAGGAAPARAVPSGVTWRRPIVGRPPLAAGGTRDDGATPQHLRGRPTAQGDSTIAPGDAMVRQPENKITTSRAWVRPVLLGLLGVGLVVGLVATLGPILQSRLLLDHAALEQRSVDERILLLQASAFFLSGHPWLGVGASNMPLAERSYPPTQDVLQPVHNVPLLIGVETGIFGLILWLIPPIVTLWNAWRRRFSLSPAGLAASTTLVAVLVPAQLDHYFWSTPIGRLLFWLALALAVLWCQRDSFKAKSA